jgi:hypothetical protein
MNNIKLALLMLSVACFLVFIVLISQYSTYFATSMGHLEDVKYKFRTRGYLSEYIIYFTALEKGFDRPQYEKYLNTTKDKLINSLENSPISETRK